MLEIFLYGLNIIDFSDKINYNTLTLVSSKGEEL